MQEPGEQMCNGRGFSELWSVSDQTFVLDRLRNARNK